MLKTSDYARNIHAAEVIEEWPDLFFGCNKAGMNIRLFPDGTIGSGLS